MQETDNVLHVESRNSTGGGVGDIDDFIIDNVVIEYKDKTGVVSFTEGTDVTAQLNAMLAALVRDGGWGGRLLLPQGGPFYLSDTIHFPQIAGQELLGQGARATRFVWRGPSDLPAFDFNRCQDCGLGHFSLEVGERVGTDKSVSSLTKSGAIATAIATGHSFTVGQFVYIFGADQRGYNGRHVVTTVPNADTFTYEVRDLPLPTATGNIVALQAATLLTAVRFYNSEIPLIDNPKVVRSQLSSKNFIERVFFKLDGQAQDGVQIVWDPDSTEELGKNDHHRLTNVQIQGYTDSGIVIQGDQTLAHVFTGCVLQARDRGQVGINTARPHVLDALGVYRAGSFKWYGGTIMENQIADLYLGRQSNGPIIVSGVHSEGSVRLLDMPNFDQDTTQLIDRVHIELTGIKHHVPLAPADGECIRYFGSGPLIISACDFGKQIDSAPYRVRFQSRQGVSNGFTYNATVSSADTTALFTAQLPSNYDAAYRHTGDNQNRALIDVADGIPPQQKPRQKPVTEADWLRVLGIVPRCWYRFGETAINDSTGSDGLIYDCNRHLPPINMIPNAAPLYRQTQNGFFEEWAQFTSATVGQQFYLNENTEINPRAHSVAFLIHHSAVTLTANDEYLCTLGCGSAGPDGGPIVRFKSDEPTGELTGGRIRATINGITQDGIYNYRTPGDYLTVAGYDYTAGGVFTVHTDRELITVPTPSTNVGNNLRKGLGTGSTAGTLKTAGFQVGLFAVFVGEAAEALIAMGTHAHRRMGW